MKHQRKQRPALSPAMQKAIEDIGRALKEAHEVKHGRVDPNK